MIAGYPATHVFDTPPKRVRGRPPGAENIKYPAIKFGYGAHLLRDQLKEQGFEVPPRMVKQWQKLVDAVNTLRTDRAIDPRHAQSCNFRISKQIDQYIRYVEKNRGA